MLHDEQHKPIKRNNQRLTRNKAMRNTIDNTMHTNQQHKTIHNKLCQNTNARQMCNKRTTPTQTTQNNQPSHRGTITDTSNIVHNSTTQATTNNTWRWRTNCSIHLTHGAHTQRQTKTRNSKTHKRHTNMWTT